MGDNTPSVSESSRSMLQNLARYAPDAIKAITGTAPGTAATQASIDQAMLPIYNELYKSGQLSSAGTEADIAEGPGQRLVDSADKYQRQLDPEYYSSRATVSDAINKYLTGYSPTELSPTEVAEISRGINATSGPATPSNLTTVRNAQVFGQAGTNRWQNFGDAITRASSALPAMKSGIQGFNVATQRGTNPLPNNSQFALANNFGFANNALGNIAANQRAIMGINDANSPVNLALKSSQALSNVASSVGSVGMSDRNIKNITGSVDRDAVLDALQKLPISKWQYKAEAGEHIGPMAQDFKKAFNLGTDDKTISLIDSNGVLIAAIQALIERVEYLENQMLPKLVNIGTL